LLQNESRINIKIDFDCLEAMRSKFPSGGMTEAEFAELNSCDPSEDSANRKRLLSMIFAAIDQDHAGA
jgi:hypothetical protein